MRIEAAGARQDPDAGARQRFWLRANSGQRLRESRAVGSHPEIGHPARPIARDLALQPSASAHEFIGLHLTGVRRRALDQVRDAVIWQKFELFGGNQAPLGEAAEVQRWPEAIAGAAEVMADRGG